MASAIEATKSAGELSPLWPFKELAAVEIVSGLTSLKRKPSSASAGFSSLEESDPTDDEPR